MYLKDSFVDVVIIHIPLKLVVAYEFGNALMKIRRVTPSTSSWGVLCGLSTMILSNHCNHEDDLMMRRKQGSGYFLILCALLSFCSKKEVERIKFSCCKKILYLRYIHAILAPCWRNWCQQENKVDLRSFITKMCFGMLCCFCLYCFNRLF